MDCSNKVAHCFSHSSFSFYAFFGTEGFTNIIPLLSQRPELSCIYLCIGKALKTSANYILGNWNPVQTFGFLLELPRFYPVSFFWLHQTEPRWIHFLSSATDQVHLHNIHKTFKNCKNVAKKLMISCIVYRKNQYICKIIYVKHPPLSILLKLKLGVEITVTNDTNLVQCILRQKTMLHEPVTKLGTLLTIAGTLAAVQFK